MRLRRRRGSALGARVLVTVARVAGAVAASCLLHTNDVLEMCSNIPSCNTAKGVSERSKCSGGKPATRNESKGQSGCLRWEGVRLHHRPVWTCLR